MGGSFSVVCAGRRAFIFGRGSAFWSSALLHFLALLYTEITESRLIRRRGAEKGEIKGQLRVRGWGGLQPSTPPTRGARGGGGGEGAAMECFQAFLPDFRVQPRSVLILRAESPGRETRPKMWRSEEKASKEEVAAEKEMTERCF